MSRPSPAPSNPWSNCVSFRDPGGNTFVDAARVIRKVRPSGWPDLEAFLNTPLCHALEREGRIVSTKLLSTTAEFRILEHDKVWFPSYPFEWPPQMLRSAGELTLELAERCLAHGFGLKDATPYNVLFRGTKPVFVDLLSFERREPRDPMWLPYAQFVRNFLLPLILDWRFGVDMKGTFLSNRDGVEPETIYALAGPLQKLLPPILTLATIPTMLGRTAGPKSFIYRPRQVSSVSAQFGLARLYRTMRKQLDRASRAPLRSSAWSSYESACPYSLPQWTQKQNLVESILKRRRPKSLLDVGCNAGTFSLLAGHLGSTVVSIDSDPVVVAALWEKARAENCDILPLVVDIARPSPAAGWRNSEYASFLTRCENQFECVLMLGLIHHLLITERIPLQAILDLAADLSNQDVIIEYVGPDDPMFRGLLRGREQLHMDFSQQSFEQACASRFCIIAKSPLAGSRRILYLLGKRTTSQAC